MAQPRIETPCPNLVRNNYAILVFVTDNEETKTCRKTAADLCSSFLQSRMHIAFVHWCPVLSHMLDESSNSCLQINHCISHNDNTSGIIWVKYASKFPNSERE